MNYTKLIITIAIFVTQKYLVIIIAADGEFKYVEDETERINTDSIEAKKNYKKEMGLFPDLRVSCINTFCLTDAPTPDVILCDESKEVRRSICAKALRQIYSYSKGFRRLTFKAEMLTFVDIYECDRITISHEKHPKLLITCPEALLEHEDGQPRDKVEGLAILASLNDKTKLYGLQSLLDFHENSNRSIELIYKSLEITFELYGDKIRDAVLTNDGGTDVKTVGWQYTYRTVETVNINEANISV